VRKRSRSMVPVLVPVQAEAWELVRAQVPERPQAWEREQAQAWEPAREQAQAWEPAQVQAQAWEPAQVQAQAWEPAQVRAQAWEPAREPAFHSHLQANRPPGRTRRHNLQTSRRKARLRRYSESPVSTACPTSTASGGSVEGRRFESVRASATR